MAHDSLLAPPPPTPQSATPDAGDAENTKKTLVVPLPGGRVEVTDDAYSDRLRCDHPEGVDGANLAAALGDLAEARGRDRVVVFTDIDVASGLIDEGFVPEAVMPDFYEGTDDCVVLAHFASDQRAELAHPREVANVAALVRRPRPPRPRPAVRTMVARPDDAEGIAALLDETFPEYPTPSHDPGYVRAQIEAGTPFRYVEEDGRVVSCASADLLPHAKNAELTDCATRPTHRGQGLMNNILGDLLSDLRERSYTGAFTLARARIPGVNLAFARLGFSLRGCMKQSCRIGEGIEDMNVWTTSLVDAN